MRRARSTHSAHTSCMRAIVASPSSPASRMRPRYGAMYCAPIDAHARACATEYTAVDQHGRPLAHERGCGGETRRRRRHLHGHPVPSARMPSALRRNWAVATPGLEEDLARPLQLQRAVGHQGSQRRCSTAAFEDGRVRGDAVHHHPRGEQRGDTVDIGAVDVQAWRDRGHQGSPRGQPVITGADSANVMTAIAVCQSGSHAAVEEDQERDDPHTPRTAPASSSSAASRPM